VVLNVRSFCAVIARGVDSVKGGSIASSSLSLFSDSDLELLEDVVVTSLIITWTLCIATWYDCEDFVPNNVVASGEEADEVTVRLVHVLVGEVEGYVSSVYVELDLALKPDG
jgi:hypothetical protein